MCWFISIASLAEFQPSVWCHYTFVQRCHTFAVTLGYTKKRKVFHMEMGKRCLESALLSWYEPAPKHLCKRDVWAPSFPKDWEVAWPLKLHLKGIHILEMGLMLVKIYLTILVIFWHKYHQRALINIVLLKRFCEVIDFYTTGKSRFWGKLFSNGFQILV